MAPAPKSHVFPEAARIACRDHLSVPAMTGGRPRRLKTLVGAANVVAASNDGDPTIGVKRAVELARKAEAETITGLFTADLLQIDPAGLAGTAGAQEPLIALAALSQATSRIGLVATVSTSFHHPYNLARQIGTLDHVSGGRAAWNAVTSSVGEENFGQALPGPEARYARAAEFIAVVNALFDANEQDAAHRKGSGAIAVDPAKFHRIDHRGEHFAVAGPLNIPPLPQGRPVLFQAGQSEAGVSVGARYAEIVYTAQPTLEGAVAFATELRRRATAYGRGEALPRVMNSFHAVIGESEADVARRLREKHARIDYEQGRLKLADMLGGQVDLAGLPLDAPLPAALLPEVESINRRRGRVEIFRRYARQGLTLRALIIEAQETGHWSVAGTPEQLADAIEERFRAGAVDVLTLHGLGNPDQEDLLLNGLLPELRRRALIDTDYIGDDFRSNLELPPLPEPATRPRARLA
ncbi:FMN-dependent oxidoreductase, nitrilotriacetate monooxygenase family [Methylobacterium pseudosasicola]|uniref:FMN-dependent oxidoreductase, nitrilotriacetate monooxygenase family n=2 Tax=Methylobacterium pseudosasicola TaxID=582667 RepID=A0A1I4Q6W8_9HYPH|nr:NtaA/DmoA family FMN-dependent monooxygenase [Methylobacterium pseudosasicola]SFM35794.1 FMN-dependent oxidoreductase, nitrilotriacetate monooxygenase family [Methylobacterium pseudosasicola]